MHKPIQNGLSGIRPLPEFVTLDKNESVLSLVGKVCNRLLIWKGQSQLHKTTNELYLSMIIRDFWQVRCCNATYLSDGDSQQLAAASLHQNQTLLQQDVLNTGRAANIPARQIVKLPI